MLQAAPTHHRHTPLLLVQAPAIAITSEDGSHQATVVIALFVQRQYDENIS